MGFTFPETLLSGRIREIRRIAKSDLHNHLLMGGQRKYLEKFSEQKLKPFHPVNGTIVELDHWIASVYRPFFLNRPGAFQNAAEAAFLQAKADGVTILEASIDSSYGTVFNISPENIVTTLQKVHKQIAPEIIFRPELGFIRGQSILTLMAQMEPYLHFDFFKAIDLYDDEFAQPVRNFKEIYRLARTMGLKCKAHVGEFGDADSVKEAVEELELDSVQHGIGAATSPTVMKWLADHKIQLNTCPSSNVRLKRTPSLKAHPIRILFDHGVMVTVNTDDVLVFGDGVSEQYLKLYKSGVFTADELDVIRENGLK
ncbi:MAG: adenosine deaminase [Bacteroidota bacterium]